MWGELQLAKGFSPLSRSIPFNRAANIESVLTVPKQGNRAGGASIALRIASKSPALLCTSGMPATSAVAAIASTGQHGTFDIERV